MTRQASFSPAVTPASSALTLTTLHHCVRSCVNSFAAGIGSSSKPFPVLPWTPCSNTRLCTVTYRAALPPRTTCLRSSIAQAARSQRLGPALDRPLPCTSNSAAEDTFLVGHSPCPASGYTIVLTKLGPACAYQRECRALLHDFGGSMRDYGLCADYLDSSRSPTHCASQPKEKRRDWPNHTRRLKVRQKLHTINFSRPTLFLELPLHT
jgi:hypothetical protein